MGARRLSVLIACVSVSSAPSRANETVIFTQPTLPGISGHFCVRCNFPAGIFSLVQWEDNPLTPDHGDVPVSWDMGAVTGLHIPLISPSNQVGIRATGRSSGAQIYENAVGAYINSNDIVRNAPGHKFIITPNVSFRRPVIPFCKSDQLDHVNVSYDLQVPRAIDGGSRLSTTYVVSDLTFKNVVTGRSMSVNQASFRHDGGRMGDWIFFDTASAMAVAVGAGAGASKFSTPSPGSEPVQIKPWLGWKHFAYQVSSTEFRTALSAVQAKYPAFGTSGNLQDWRLVGWHLNAELLFQEAPAEMGWSLRATTIAIFSGDAGCNASLSAGSPRKIPQKAARMAWLSG